MTNDSAAFWDKIARRYAGMTIRNPEAYEMTLDLVRARLRPDDHVLELGCGTGTTALRLADAVAHYVGNDYAPEMIAIAEEKRTEAQVENLVFCTGQLGDGSLPKGPFDVILGFNVLHLLPDRQSAFANIAQNLRPGGLLISKTPCLGGVYRLLQPLVAVMRLMGKAPKLSFLTLARLERDIKAAGFEILETGSYPKRPPSRFIVAKKL
ncbi:class I SAM-dependent methyltransferase [Yoonia sp.]|uniref:class I SAM-dependent methyltransferase n=1 Tax=Yoonia sp. TaxID=2212373 RepID=UPI00358E6354